MPSPMPAPDSITVSYTHLDVYKRQAMYEQFGVPGMAAYEKTVSYCQEKGLVVIGDIKRGDIGSTSEAYAVGHLGHVQVGSKSYAGFHEDFATVNPYLGSDGVKPFIKVCKEEKKGIFVLVKTSNPSSGEFQDRIIDGRPLYECCLLYTSFWQSVEKRLFDCREALLKILQIEHILLDQRFQKREKQVEDIGSIERFFREEEALQSRKCLFVGCQNKLPPVEIKRKRECKVKRMRLVRDGKRSDQAVRQQLDVYKRQAL